MSSGTNEIQTQGSQPVPLWRIPTQAELGSSESGQPMLGAYWQIIRRRRWIVSTCFLGVFLTVLIGTVKEKPTYRATGSLEIEMPQATLANLQTLFQTPATTDTYLETQVRILTSDQLTSRASDHLARLGGMIDQTSSAAGRMAFRRQLDVELVRGTHLLEISFEDSDPGRAADGVNVLTAEYLNAIREQRSETAQDASSWLLDQVRETKSKLEQATTELQEYEQEHPALAAAPTSGTTESPLQSELAAAQSDRITRESIYRQAASGETSVLESPLLTQLLGTEATLSDQYAQLTATYGRNFPRVRQIQAQVDDVQARIAAEQERQKLELKTQYEGALERENLVRQEIDREEAMTNGTAQEILQDNILKRSVDLNKQLYDGLLQRLADAGMTSKMETTNARVVDSAKPPTSPIRPQVAKNLGLGAVTGLTLGILLAFASEHFEATFTNAADLENTMNLPVLGVVPAVLLRAALGRAAANSPAVFRATRLANSAGRWFRMDRDGAEYFQLTEAIRNLRTSLLFAIDTTQPRSLLISSAVPAEGKTTISCNVAIALAQLGKRVLLIDGDLRRPSVHKCFGVSNESGLSTYLQGRQDWLRLTVPAGVPNLTLLTCGKIPAEPVELLSTDRMKQLTTSAYRDFDFVIVDSPTLVNMADSRILSSYVDAVVLVVRSNSTSRKLVKQAQDNLRTASAKVIGLVLNQLDRHDEQYSYSYYGESVEEGSKSERNTHVTN